MRQTPLSVTFSMRYRMVLTKTFMADRIDIRFIRRRVIMEKVKGIILMVLLAVQFSDNGYLLSA
jgi:hypothetical protein